MKSSFTAPVILFATMCSASLGLANAAGARQASTAAQPSTAAVRVGPAVKPSGFAPRGTCPCTVGTPENEPDCGLPADTVNGGCNYEPNRFAPISPGQTICGTAGTMVVDGLDRRDTDWYEFTINNTATIRWSVQAEFPVQIVILARVCPAGSLVTEFGAECTEAVATLANATPGTYCVFVAPSVFNGLPCDGGSNSYRATLTTSIVNDACANAIDVSAGGIFIGSLEDANNDGSAPCGSSSSNPDVWYKYTAASCGTLTVTTCGTHDMGGTDAGIDTVVSLHDRCGGTALACNDDWFAEYCLNADMGLPRDSVVTAPVAAGQTIMIRVSKFGAGRVGPFLLNVAATTAVANDACASAAVIGTGTTSFCTTGATTDGPVNNVCRTPLNDVWYRYTATCEGRVTVDTCTAATFDTVLTAYSSLDCSNLTDANVLECNDDAGCGTLGLQSSITFNARAGLTYLIRVGGYQGATGEGAITIRCNPCPCDFNGDSFLNSQDFFDFLSCLFGTGCPIGSSADINSDGFVNSQDFFDFITCFFAGLPGC